MATYQVDILHPKAKQLLQDLADLDLISIKAMNTENFQKPVTKPSAKDRNATMKLDEMSKQAEMVRAKRFAKIKESLGNGKVSTPHR